MHGLKATVVDSDLISYLCLINICVAKRNDDHCASEENTGQIVVDFLITVCHFNVGYTLELFKIWIYFIL